MSIYKNLADYRCQCGKLLFKAKFIGGVVEIKCRRCGLITEFYPDTNQEAAMVFVLTVNLEGSVVDVSNNAEYVLGRERNELLGSPLAAICPTIHDSPANDLLRNETNRECYRIENNPFLLKDGARLPTDTYIWRTTTDEGVRTILLGVVPPGQLNTTSN